MGVFWWSCLCKGLAEWFTSLYFLSLARDVMLCAPDDLIRIISDCSDRSDAPARWVVWTLLRSRWFSLLGRVMEILLFTDGNDCSVLLSGPESEFVGLDVVMWRISFCFFEFDRDSDFGVGEMKGGSLLSVGLILCLVEADLFLLYFLIKHDGESLAFVLKIRKIS